MTLLVLGCKAMITRKVEYMLLALIDLAEHNDGSYLLSRDVAERQGIPGKYMPQLMAVLTRNGWVDSARGARGGVRLASDPSKVTVEAVIHASGDPLLIKECAGTRVCPKEEGCRLHPLWTRAQAALTEAMRTTSLADLLK